MRFVYLPQHEAFAFLRGDSIIDFGGVRFFESREQAHNAARNRGLGIHPSGKVFVRASNKAREK